MAKHSDNRTPIKLNNSKIKQRQVTILQNDKDQLLATIKEKETQLFHASKGANSWNPGKNGISGNTQTSKIHVKSLQKEIKDLYIKLAEIKKSAN